MLLHLTIFIDDSHLDLLTGSIWLLFDLLWHLELIRRLSTILLLDLGLLLVLFLDLLLNLLKSVLFKSKPIDSVNILIGSLLLLLLVVLLLGLLV